MNEFDKGIVITCRDEEEIGGAEMAENGEWLQRFDEAESWADDEAESSADDEAEMGRRRGQPMARLEMAGGNGERRPTDAVAQMGEETSDYITN
nr:hypothetical protein Itr_chr14CG11890 [Ipomoea trifida]